MTEKKNIFTNPCTESWEDMTGDERKRMCAICQENVQDVSQMDLKTVAEAYVDSRNCVRMNKDQVQFFQFLRSIPRVASLSAALSLFPFVDAKAQAISDEDTCTVYGKVHSNVTSNRRIFVIVNGQTFETSSDEHGSFKLKLPKAQKIESSNIRQLDRKTLKKDFIALNKAHLPKVEHILMGKTIGTPSF